MSADASMAADPGWKYMHATLPDVLRRFNGMILLFSQDGGYLFTANPAFVMSKKSKRASKWLGFLVNVQFWSAR
jgi:hypothetical protein